MDVTIRAVLTTAELTSRIAFATLWGDGQGTWIGLAPREGDRYEVELEMGTVLRWGDTVVIVADDGTPCRFAVENGTLIVDGVLEHVEVTRPADVCTIRLDASLLRVETVGDAPAPGCHVRMSVPNLQLFDTNF